MGQGDVESIGRRKCGDCTAYEGLQGLWQIRCTKWEEGLGLALSQWEFPLAIGSWNQHVSPKRQNKFIDLHDVRTLRTVIGATPVVKTCIVIRDTETLYFLSRKSIALIFRLCGRGSSSQQIVACIGETRNTTGFLWGNLKERNSFEELCLYGRIALKCILLVYAARAWIGLIGQRIGTGGGFL